MSSLLRKTQLATSWLKKRGWPSADAIQKAKLELVARQLIVKTRLGGLNAGPDMWAVTWLNVSDCAGLDLRTEQHIPGAWHLFAELEKQKKRSVTRNSAVPSHGTAPRFTIPPPGTKTALLTTSAIPSDGNNVSTDVPSKKSRKRIVGKSGKSGRKSTAQKSEPPTSASKPVAASPQLTAPVRTSNMAMTMDSSDDGTQPTADTEGNYTRERDDDEEAGNWNEARGEFAKPPVKASSKQSVIASVNVALESIGTSRSEPVWATAC